MIDCSAGSRELMLSLLGDSLARLSGYEAQIEGER